MAKWTFVGANPIVNYTIGFELAVPLAADSIKELSSLGPKFANDLPRKVEQQAFVFQTAFPQSAQTQLGGVIFDELARDGKMRKQLSVLPSLIRFTAGEYERWAEFWSLAERVLRLVMNVALQSSKVSGVSLDAVNRFYWDGAEDNINYSSLIKKNCSYLVPNILKQKSLCHSFHGFVRERDGEEYRRIDNISFAVSERVDNKNPADLAFNLRLVFGSKLLGADDLFNEDDSDSEMAKIFRLLHEANNTLFSEVVANKICDAIPGLPA